MTTSERLEQLAALIWIMTPAEKRQLIQDLEPKVSPETLDNIKMYCALSDKSVRETMFNKLWADAHPAN